MAVSLEVVMNTLTWESFCNDSPAYSIALDGYVFGGPKYDDKGPRLNLNHHEDVDRLATRSTCAQVLMSIRLGLFTRFRKDGEATAHVYVNDCDEDVCTSWFLLKHHHMSEGVMNPLINRLVAMEDVLDCTAGAYPFPKDLPTLKELAWVFEPYRQFRANGSLDKKDPAGYRSVLCDVENRILRHISGHGDTVSLDLRYERIGGGKGWTMVKEIGAQARTGMLSDGINLFVAVRERPNGRYTYTIGKTSPFIQLNLVELADSLTQIEGEDDETDHYDPWGGASTVIGSPRSRGSKLTPAELSKILDDAL